MTTSVIDDLKRSQILELLEQGKREDGRSFDEPRKLTVQVDAIPKANGSARVRLGETEAVCGVKIQPDRPFPDMGDKGIFICTAELLPLSHPSVETGPPGPEYPGSRPAAAARRLHHERAAGRRWGNRARTRGKFGRWNRCNHP